MNILNTTKEKITPDNGMILCGHEGINTVSFIADIPKSAVVDHIRVDGVFLEDINTKKIRYRRDLFEPVNDKKLRIAATVEFEEYDLDLFSKLENHIVQGFEVYYHLEAVVETD